MKAFINLFLKIKRVAANSKLVLTITGDNGIEFAEHVKIKNQLNADFYFAHPYSSWERGLNENTNGLLRQYFPKGSDFSHIDEAYLNKITEELNQRPRKDLDYLTPDEMFEFALKNSCCDIIEESVAFKI
jgi:IS30 family transposase